LLFNARLYIIDKSNITFRQVQNSFLVFTKFKVSDILYAYNNQTPGKYPKEYIQDSKHGESLKSRMSDIS
jgi:hypothetical protein